MKKKDSKWKDQRLDKNTLVTLKKKRNAFQVPSVF